jgi:hypothetical protein
LDAGGMQRQHTCMHMHTRLVLPHLAWFCPGAMFICWFKIMLLRDQETPCTAVHWNAGYWQLVGQILHGLDSVMEKFTAAIADFFITTWNIVHCIMEKKLKYKWLKQHWVTCYAFSVTQGRVLNAYIQSHSLWYGSLYTIDLLWT